MRRFAVLLLSLLVLASGFAQAIDRHMASGCADGASPTLSEPATPAEGSVPGLHTAGCCFGSMVVTLPADYLMLPVTLISHAAGPYAALPPSWYSESPERPPRS